MGSDPEESECDSEPECHSEVSEYDIEEYNLEGSESEGSEPDEY